MMKTDILKKKSILITGGTGSFGGKLLERIISGFDKSDYPEKIVIFSRDEKKQHDMRIKFKNHTFIKFVIGDVRNSVSVMRAFEGIDYVFHAAALKQVPVCEFFPDEAIQTNVMGASNVLNAAEAHNIKKIIVLSTDKAVYPINTMGMTKAIMEKMMIAKARDSAAKTVFCGVRYGNVMYSRGSVLPLFIEQIKHGDPLTITHPDMTRFLLPLDRAIDLVLFALEHGRNGDILVRKAPAATVGTIAKAVSDLFSYKGKIKIIGVREGEKLDETLVTKEELIKSEEYDEYFRVKSLAAIDYDKYYINGVKVSAPKDDYTSANTGRLTLKGTIQLISSLPEMRTLIKTKLASGEYRDGTLLGWEGEK